MNFEQAFDKTVFEWEGGDRLHEIPGDPGGLTKYGISQRAHPDVDVRNLDEVGAMRIYRDEYWSPLRAGALPDELRWDVFDYGVNAGVGKSAQTLQHAINLCNLARNRGLHLIDTDGRIGPNTISAAGQLPPLRLLRVFRALRTRHYLVLAEGRPGSIRFLEGWLDRVNGERGTA